MLGPTLAAVGYSWEHGGPGHAPSDPGLASRLSQWLGRGVSAGPNAEPGGAGGAVQGPGPALIARPTGALSQPLAAPKRPD